MNFNEQKRITKHPVLEIPSSEIVYLYFDGKKLAAKKGEMLSSALIANNIDIFSYHQRDNSPQGISCANGQCAQCTVLVNGIAVKSCMTPVETGMEVETLIGAPSLSEEDKRVVKSKTLVVEVDVLIIGAGPSGLQAALTLAEYGAKVLLIDDKDQLGGKLLLQTHKFFGSVEDSYAGTRGIDIAVLLGEKVRSSPNIEVWLSSPAIAVFSDKHVGVLMKEMYVLVKPRKLLIATGAREKMLAFPGNTLPGVYGAGAFQTLVNRDLVKSSNKVFVVGGGNVGIIAAYHAIQAGIDVVGVVEALPECGAYKVHEDKIRRLGVPIFTSHTIIAAHGKDKVDSVTISKIDENFKLIKGTEVTFNVDTILIAIGLDPVNEFHIKAEEAEMDVWSAGDAHEIAEASSAMFSGKIRGWEIALSLGLTKESVPIELKEKAAILKSKPGPVVENNISYENKGVYPIIRCNQEIPCNPCAAVCPYNLIRIPGGGLLGRPEYQKRGDEECIGCAQCVAICPGLAITLVDYNEDINNPKVTIPTELFEQKLEEGETLLVVDEHGQELGKYRVLRVRILKKFPKTQLVTIQLPKEIAPKAISFKTVQTEQFDPIEFNGEIIPDSAIICRCERVTAGEIRALIKEGVRDANEIKALTRAGMGACGAKVCTSLIERIFREEGVSREEYTPFTQRPLFVEVPLKHFLGYEEED